MSLKFFLIVIGFCILIVIWFKFYARYGMKRNRKFMELIEIYEPVSEVVSFEVFGEVMSAIGRFYGLDPRILRPSDALNRLYELDSWDMGMATEEMNQWLIERGVKDEHFSGKTILDLAVHVENSSIGSKRLRGADC